ncbi:site-specific integrase [Bacillus thuringiensis]|uniref:tyrosine-type recombinase/integrase n=1 Tax=Bacillus thuringiensis TaxID=1428 RepID=UPI000BFA2AAE|nr:tyrosine-type recombinase/integrase [Bacillus thuringiensis]PGA19357.1 site-specific integrase [Bacillus thuringiensis]
MKGYFRKRGEKWSFTIDIGRDPLTGKRKQKTVSGFKTKKEAERACNELIHQFNTGSLVDDKNLTLSEYLQEWLENTAKQRVRDTTFINYRRAVNSRIIPVVGSHKLKDLKPLHGQRFVKSLIDEELSPKYIEYIFIVLKGALEDAVKWELLYKNPFEHVEIPRPRKVVNNTWSIEETKTFLTYAKFDNPIYYHLFLLALNTGMRRGELLGLKWKNVDLVEGKVSVTETLIYDELGFRFTEPKTSGSKRLISIDQSLCKELKSYKAKQNEFKLAIGKAYEDNDLVFSRENGRPIYPRTLTTVFERFIKTAQVPKIRFHDLRHTHATLLLKLGINPKIVSERLGHNSIKTTLDTYSHVTLDMQESATIALSEALKS